MLSPTIKDIAVANLTPHPKNREIYGITVADDFVERVKRLGILEPLIVKADGTIISGHRRWLAARKCGLDTVPARLAEFEDELDEIEMLIICNDQREKTFSEMAAEMAELKRIESERARRRMGEECPHGKENLPYPEGQARDIIAAKYNISGKQVDKMLAIFTKSNNGDENAQELVKALDAGTVSVHKAYKALYRSYQEKQREVDDLKANPEKEIVFEAPSELVRELESLKSEKIRLQDEKAQLEERISKARAEKKDVDDLLRKKASLQEALKDLVKQKDEQETYVQYATELATALQDIRRLLESKKGTIERLAKTGIPGAWDAKHVMDVRDLCYEFGELLTTSISTVSVWGSVKKEDEE